MSNTDLPTPPPPPVPPKGPIVAPKPKSRVPYYVAHTTFHLPSGDRYVRGDVLRDDDALAFEVAVSNGEADINFATPSLRDPNG